MKAVPKSTHVPTGNSRRIAEACNRLDLTFPAARAIADALVVLTALERSETNHDGRTSTGGGMAEGRTLRDDTMPDLASHLVELLYQMHTDARSEFDYLLQAEKEAANA